MIDYVNVLREGIAEAYTGIVAGLRAGNRGELLAFSPSQYQAI